MAEFFKVIHSEVSTGLKGLPSESIQCVVTSPPYWGLRDYGVEGQIGLERTPHEYISKMALVFHEIKRVVKNDGVVWLNIGDTYIKKSLAGIPWRLAIAMMDGGWILRSEVIWEKPNSMPESAKDRPTRSHEHVFMFSKNKKYFYDNRAVVMPNSESTIKRAEAGYSHGGGDGTLSKYHGGRKFVADGANLRSVWSIPTASFRDAHFAVFPMVLPERCIRISSRIGDTVLDPFAGSGTTLAAAVRLDRNAIGIELNLEYIKIIERRCAEVAKFENRLLPFEKKLPPL